MNEIQRGTCPFIGVIGWGHLKMCQVDVFEGGKSVSYRIGSAEFGIAKLQLCELCACAGAALTNRK